MATADPRGIFAIPYLCGMSSVAQEKRILFMIRGFFDESASGDIFLVAGWVSKFENWRAFTEDWQTVLDTTPAVDYFKHHEAKSKPPSGQFAGWSPEKIEAKIAALVEVICKHEMYGVECGLRVATHNAAFSAKHVSRKQIRSMLKGSHYYQSCVFRAESLVLEIQFEKGQKGEIVDCIFDEMSGLLPECITLHQRFKKCLPGELRNICGILSEGIDTEIAALQAADLLAGQIARKLRTGAAEEHLRRMFAAHEIYHGKAYSNNFQNIPDLVCALDAIWGTLHLSRKMERAIEALLSKSDNANKKS
jgi:hypothetical protein